MKIHKQTGFTLVEVMIVLAVAGIIIIVVLLAFPQIQKSQRNEARRSIARRILPEFYNFYRNNQGNIPEPIIPATSGKHVGQPGDEFGFFANYLKCEAGPPPTCGIRIDDPVSGQPVGTGMDGSDPITTTIVSVGGAPEEAPGSIAYGTGQLCDGETSKPAEAGKFVFMIRLEGGPVYCMDNF